MSKPDKKIFTENFTGSIDDLLNFTAEKADMVEDVFEGRKDVLLTADEVRKIIHEDHPKLTSDEIEFIIKEIQMEETDRHLNSLIQLGLVEIKAYEDGVPVYGLTELGEEYYNKNIKDKNDHKTE